MGIIFSLIKDVKVEKGLSTPILHGLQRAHLTTNAVNRKSFECVEKPISGTKTYQFYGGFLECVSINITEFSKVLMIIVEGFSEIYMSTI